ncbi:unnamed protein product [Phaedon cochleariae]|uniref:MADF domain-containing protein n=1 Tax=Phaedon cochleariae TaxID=80249 RepID=A0A9N9SGH0_PHACE|nr:unnamed protein product [Phaedon cochleariae]
MQDHENNFTAEQCCNKMKRFICKYKEIKDYNGRSGNTPKQWQYYQEMADYIGDRPGITPIASCSSLSASQTVTRKTSKPCEEKHKAEKESEVANQLRKEFVSVVLQELKC